MIFIDEDKDTLRDLYMLIAVSKQKLDQYVQLVLSYHPTALITVTIDWIVKEICLSLSDLANWWTLAV